MKKYFSMTHFNFLFLILLFVFSSSISAKALHDDKETYPPVKPIDNENQICEITKDKAQRKKVVEQYLKLSNSDNEDKLKYHFLFFSSKKME
jgi:uncharacterized protein YpmS